ENAGFTTGTPWIKVNPNYRTINAQSQLTDENSIRSYYKKLIALRKAYPIIVYGDYTLLLSDDEQIFAYQRTLEGQKLLVLCNYSGDRTKQVRLQDWEMEKAQLLLSNMPVNQDISFSLEPYEARVYLL
ncbi:MAG: alpha-glucosidase C-terminal domain-containing protein, partial [Clostridia bacterium]|nr:alpha-glucosidase C-terminal domain-containing protein [Clostridia bacterium]